MNIIHLEKKLRYLKPILAFLNLIFHSLVIEQNMVTKMFGHFDHF